MIKYELNSNKIAITDTVAVAMIPRGILSRGLSLLTHSGQLRPAGETIDWLLSETHETNAETCVAALTAFWPDMMAGQIEKLTELFLGQKIYLINSDTPHPSTAAVRARFNLCDAESDLLDLVAEMASKGFKRPGDKPKRINILGLGDVGSTMALAIQAYGRGVVDEIGLFDLDPARISRWEMELNQIAMPLEQSLPKVIPLTQEMLFDCDLFAFTASVGVPPLTVTQGDVRIIQFQGNSKLVELYAKAAVEAGFEGIFAIVSDPVDLLARHAFKATNFDEQGQWHGKGLAIDQIRGYGLGVMNGRAGYFSRQHGTSYEYGRAFGPHGQGLVIANDWRSGYYEDNLSQTLTQDTTTANLAMRTLGYKPYVAPAVASGAISLIKTLAGEWHYSCIPFNGIYYGCLNRRCEGIEVHEQLPLPEALATRILESYKELDNQWMNL